MVTAPTYGQMYVLVGGWLGSYVKSLKNEINLDLIEVIQVYLKI